VEKLQLWNIGICGPLGFFGIRLTLRRSDVD